MSHFLYAGVFAREGIELSRLFYNSDVSITGYCFRLTNATHQIGCSGMPLKCPVFKPNGALCNLCNEIPSSSLNKLYCCCPGYLPLLSREWSWVFGLEVLLLNPVQFSYLICPIKCALYAIYSCVCPSKGGKRLWNL